MDQQSKVYIWQLQEKTDSINKDAEYCIIYDQALKKVLVAKIYDFFNQDDKILDVKDNIEILLREYDSEFDIKYDDLEISTGNYDQLVENLQEQFKINEDNIRVLDTRISEMENSNNETSTKFIEVDGKYKILASTIDNFRTKVSEFQITTDTHSSDIETLNEEVSDMQTDIDTIYNNFTSINDIMEDIEKHDELTEKKDEFLKRLESEYDRIVSIIDYYHHIHDDGDYNPDKELEDALIDFYYTKNEETGMYEITGWKETYMGKPSTECIIPSSNRILI